MKFSTAIDRAAQLGARIFIEIGPRSILLSNMNEILEANGLACATMGTASTRPEPRWHSRRQG